ncbi:hypothetical protein GF373_13060 [bacterium]|nr:hypothetical protein [bacterium]
MAMDDATWQRHASPWSVWTRVFTGLPAILGAVWSIRPLGWWSLPTLVLACLWIWLNPRLFPPPKNTNNWGSKVTFGERVWLNRKTHPIPKHHACWAMALAVISGIGFFIALYGAFYHYPLPTIAGALVSWFGKMWFCDRMVWLYEDMKDTNPDYQAWLKTD